MTAALAGTCAPQTGRSAQIILSSGLYVQSVLENLGRLDIESQHASRHIRHGAAQGVSPNHGRESDVWLIVPIRRATYTMERS
jgi:hypothetical protein